MLKLKAHAKLNLFLEVVGRRYDGYHELQSHLVFVELHDELSFEKANELVLVNNEIENNIIIKTAQKLRDVFAISDGAKITLQKRIPLASGMGGGSADAAATILGLKKLWGFEASDDQLYDIALQLGADVPACLYSILENKNSVFFSGIGEQLTEAQAPQNLYFVLVNPLKQLSTASVFAQLQNFAPAVDSFDLLDRRNDLQAPAIELLPEIAQILLSLEQQNDCLFARMTGSGATCFAVFESEIAALLADEKLKTTFPNYWVQYTKLK